MYQKVGEVSNLPHFAEEPYWNPPGWGSVKVQFPGATLAMLVGIKPGGYIPFHVDNPAAENAVGTALDRYHIVLQTNPNCWNFHDGVWQQLRTGEVYRMDPFREHASINLGSTTRLHLVIDYEKESRRPWAPEE